MANGFRFVVPFYQYLLQSALGVLNGGTLWFYQSGTTTLQNTYSDPALTQVNPNPVPIGANGLTESDIWLGSTPYRVTLLDAQNNVVWTADNVQLPGGAGATIPSLVSGEFLTNDGINLLWSAIRQLPDPTGQSGKLVWTPDGSTFGFTSPPTPPAAPVFTFGPNSIKFGNSGGPYVLVQWGSGTAAATGGGFANFTVTFPTPYSVTPYADISGNGIVLSGSIGAAPFNVNTVTTAGIVGGFYAHDGGSFVNPSNFNWFAIGQVNS